jgi:peroxiredoxin
MKYIAALTMSALLMALPLSAAQKAHKKLPINHPAGSVARVGQKAPDFSLTDIDGKRRTLQEFVSAGKAVVLFWFDPDCQVIKRHFQIDRTFPGLYSSYGKRKVIFVAINSADSGRALLATRADFVKEWRAHSPILIDSGGTVGKIYGSKSSPHIFVVGSDGIIKYAGAIDNDTKGEKAGAGQIDYLVLALDEILAGKPVTEAETDPYGCRIKYSR